MRSRLSYANVVSTLALVVAVTGGGTAVAAGLRKNSVTTASIQNNAVTSAKVKNGTIGGADVKDRSLGGIDIADGSLGGQDIADRSLGGQDIAPGSLGGYNLAAGTLGSREIADGSLSSADISDGTISEKDLAKGAITSANIGRGTIMGSNVAPKTITLGNLDPGAVDALAGGAVASGRTITGYAAIAYVAPLASDNKPEVRALSVSFPAVATGITNVKGAGAEECKGGTFAKPATSKPGVACYFFKDDPANHVGTADLLDMNEHGFALAYRPPATDWTFGQITWAYTAP